MLQSAKPTNINGYRTRRSLTFRLSPRRSFKGGKQEKEGRANKETRYDPNKETLPIQVLVQFFPRYATNNISIKGYGTRRSRGITQLSPRVRINTPLATVKQYKGRRLESATPKWKGRMSQQKNVTFVQVVC
ncbi:hypothetical protein BCR33DRAFT_725640, partial [Rhizoclosmatium globosum]